jgi:hypothetical protein
MRDAATVGEWLSAIEPPPPAALASRLKEALGAHSNRPASEVPEACLEAGEELLDALLASGSTSRATAIDLLAVDSLVTYAFEVAADQPDRLESRSAQAMSRIACIPGEHQA